MRTELKCFAELHKLTFLMGSFLLMTFHVHSQEIKRSSINALGNSTSANNIGLSQSVGQAGVTPTATSNSITLRQGFQQPLILVSEDQTREIQITVFPNPNDGQFSFLTNLDGQEQFSYQLSDAAGRIIRKDKGTGGQRIEVQLESSVQSGSYTLYITTEKKWTGNTTIIITK